jgi:hypothetical protein
MKVINDWDATTLVTTPVANIFDRFKKRLTNRANREKQEIVNVVERQANAKMVKQQ